MSPAPLSAPAAGTPAYLQQAYDLTYLSQTTGAGDTVAVVDAGDDLSAQGDLATYRSTYGLPALYRRQRLLRQGQPDRRRLADAQPRGLRLGRRRSRWTSTPSRLAPTATSCSSRPTAR